MEWLAHALRTNVELALFVSLALGYGLGALRLGSFELGPVLGTLIAGLVVGQVGIAVPGAMQNAFFVLFLFAIGFRTGPEFFQSLRSSAVSQVMLTILLCVTALAVTWSLILIVGLDGGTAAGLLAGAMTNSTALGTATSATASLGLDPATTQQLAQNVATSYALTYVLGTVLAIWFLPTIGPRLMRINLREASRELESASSNSGIQAAAGANREMAIRAYRLPPACEGRTVDELERMWSSGQRVIIERVRRADALLDAAVDMRLEAGDVLAVAGRSPALVGPANPLKEEVSDPALLNIPTISADVVLTNRRFAGQTLKSLSQEVAARHIFLLGVRRAGRELPFAWSTVVERGDVMSVTGTRQEIARVAAEIGFAEYSTASTNLALVATTIVLGGLVGLPALALGKLSVSLSVPVGVLIAGLTLGHLRSVNPRFGRIPDASVWLFESLGLGAFLALVGLQAGSQVVDAIRSSGLLLILAGVLLTLVPHVVTILVGHYVVGMNPGILLGLCAGAGTSAPALAAIEKAADSKVPTFGYGMACAIGNVLMALWGTLIVLLGGT